MEFKILLYGVGAFLIFIAIVDTVLDLRDFHRRREYHRRLWEAERKR